MKLYLLPALGTENVRSLSINRENGYILTALSFQATLTQSLTFWVTQCPIKKYTHSSQCPPAHNQDQKFSNAPYLLTPN